MARFALTLRCLLILAFCLDSSAAAWRSSAMAANMARHVGNAVAARTRGELADSGLAGSQRADEVAGIAASSVGAPVADDASAGDCPEKRAGDKGGNAHGDCDCSGAGCSCPCGFTTVAAAHTVPFAAQHLLVSVPMTRQPTLVALRTLSPVFRPPIG